MGNTQENSVRPGNVTPSDNGAEWFHSTAADSHQPWVHRPPESSSEYERWMVLGLAALLHLRNKGREGQNNEDEKERKTIIWKRKKMSQWNKYVNWLCTCYAWRWGYSTVLLTLNCHLCSSLSWTVYRNNLNMLRSSLQNVSHDIF